MLRRDAAARIISRRPARGHLYSRMAGAGLVSSEEVTMGSTDSATSEADRGRGRRVGGAGRSLVGLLAVFAAAGVVAIAVSAAPASAIPSVGVPAATGLTAAPELVLALPGAGRDHGVGRMVVAGGAGLKQGAGGHEAASARA